MPETQQAITLIERYGAFGLLVVILAAAGLGLWFGVRWAGAKLDKWVPMCLDYLERKDAKHEEKVKQITAEHKQEMNEVRDELNECHEQHRSADARLSRLEDKIR